MPNFAAKIGYPSSNGLGYFITGSPDVLINGLNAIRRFDLASNETTGNSSSRCRNNNLHCHPSANQVSSTVFINGIGAHRVGDYRVCSNSHVTLISPGSTNNVIIGD